MRRCICLLPLVLFLFVSCGGDDSGTPPVVNNAELLAYDQYGNKTYKTTFAIGEVGDCEITFTDPDLDVVRFEITEYFPEDSNTPFNGPFSFNIDEDNRQDASEETYVIYYEAESPAGTYREEVQAFDAKGNAS